MKYYNKLLSLLIFRTFKNCFLASLPGVFTNAVKSQTKCFNLLLENSFAKL